MLHSLNKEVYEPLWEDLYAHSKASNGAFRIRSIWIADVAHQGQSYILNEGLLGNDRTYMPSFVFVCIIPLLTKDI